MQICVLTDDNQQSRGQMSQLIRSVKKKKETHPNPAATARFASMTA